ncbi:acyl-CoA dehydrogenase C-terminal domain-containing protein [Benzoatithermus flavus]|uniref:Acyl-CoA dehydrogenase C-terminal domain-containing protein n=1 Tax=Benzoatithermus flavus TaxID=3108223 RepID=A0ABU8XZQ0_9PROT
MHGYSTPLRDMRFVLHELLGAERLSGLPGYADATPETIDAVLEEAAKLAENVLAPLNRSGDEEGCVYENGVVRTPRGFKEAYARFREGGWTGVSAAPEHGGQGLPKLVNFVLEEMFSSANFAFAIYPGLSQGAYNAIQLHAEEGLQRIYLPKLADGSWSGTMCLTEPQCGTDLGLIHTRAVPAEDGSYRLTGTKIFISAGEHDLTSNIVHLVLARLPDAPTGTRGISLFVVPKFLPVRRNGGWEAGARNGVRCAGIEHKMGIKASSTCTMQFEDAVGWLVGEPHKGMRAMFTMMNGARLAVGLQGLAAAEAAYQKARAYARERLQGRSLKGAAMPGEPADPIIVHPDVRRNLLTIKAFVEGARALAYWVGYHLDLQARHPDPAERAAADDLAALMTPIVKAFLTDQGFTATNLAMQVFGGHGYIRETGVEQHVRDVRIAQIYEGANGIQALDLVGRKLGQNTGRLLRRFFHPMAAFLEEHGKDPTLAELLAPLARAFGRLQQATVLIAQKGLKDPEEAAAAASDYLQLFGYVALGWMWARMAVVAREKLPRANGEASFYDAKLQTAHFYMQRTLPHATAHFAALAAGKDSLMVLPADAF